MREGAWINAKTGEYVWVDDHARWLRRNPDQAAKLGLPAEVIAELGEIGWDLTPLAERVIVLYKAMEAGLIRARGHGVYLTLEHTIPWDQAVRGAQRFMSENCGPLMTCRFNSLNKNRTIEFLYGHYSTRLGETNLGFLKPHTQRAQPRPPLPPPFLLSNITSEGWICWALPTELKPQALVDLIRDLLPLEGGWLALSDGRTWKLTPNTPPIRRVDDVEALRRFEKCPDCGWPRVGTIAPCQCLSRQSCCTCGIPVFWPTPRMKHVCLDGRVVLVPHKLIYSHCCVPWPSVILSDVQSLLGWA